MANRVNEFIEWNREYIKPFFPIKRRLFEILKEKPITLEDLLSDFVEDQQEIANQLVAELGFEAALTKIGKDCIRLRKLQEPKVQLITDRIEFLMLNLRDGGIFGGELFF